jgi:restriction system protein
VAELVEERLTCLLSLMRPLLALHADGDQRTQKGLRDALAREFDLSEDDLDQRLPSGTAKTFNNRVGWATTYLVRAGLLDRPRRAATRITDRGKAVLADHPDRLDNSILDTFEEFRDFRNRRSDGGPPAGPDPDPALSQAETPEEAIEAAYTEIRASLGQELLSRVLARDDAFFEELVLDVLLGMGYGGSKRDAAERVGRSGDGGIDGVIREDRLGLDVIYVQAKKWAPERHIAPRDIREFVGTLQDARVNKGVFITTSRFSPEARQLARRQHLVIIDGAELADLMIDAGVGVTYAKAYEVKRLDEDYFAADDETT